MPPVQKIRGKIKGIETIPGLNGDLATYLPTDQYDLTLLDKYGADVMSTTITNRSGTIAQYVFPSTTILIDSELTLIGATCGDNKKFRVIIYLGGY